MSGRKISDKGGYPASADAMMKSKTHLKGYSSEEGAGAIMDYPDTSEKIKRDQGAGVSKMKGRQMKPGYRY